MFGWRLFRMAIVYYFTDHNELCTCYWPAIVQTSLTDHGNGNGVASTEESSPTSQGGPNDENLETQESILSELRKTREDVSRNLRENTEAIWYL